MRQPRLHAIVGDTPGLIAALRDLRKRRPRPSKRLLLVASERLVNLIAPLDPPPCPITIARSGDDALLPVAATARSRVSACHPRASRCSPACDTCR
jgi:hypothetical protein